MRTAMVLISLLVLVAWFNEPQARPVQWSAFFGDTYVPEAVSIKTDGAGNTILGGVFLGVVDFGGGNITGHFYEDVYITKRDANGTHLWTLVTGNDAQELLTGLDVDAAGNIYVTGWSNSMVDFGGGPLLGSSDIFLAKLAPDGSHIWSKLLDGNYAPQPTGLALDADANIFLTGQFQQNLDLGGGIHTATGSQDVFIAKYDSSGTYLWSNIFGDVGTQVSGELAVDAAGNIVITGGNYTTIDFGGGPLTTVGGIDIYVAAFDSSGTHLWSKQFGTTSFDVIPQIAADDSGNVYLHGIDPYGINLGGAWSSTGYLYMAKLSSAAGDFVWGYQYGSSGGAGDMTIGPDQNLYITGIATADLDFGGGILPRPALSFAYLGQFDLDGNHLDSSAWSATSYTTGEQLAVSAAAEVHLAGYFQGTLDLGTGPMISSGYKTYLMKMAVPFPKAPLIISLSDINPDQGGQLRILFQRAGFDEFNSMDPITHYDIFRRIDPVKSAKVAGWEPVGTLPAHGDSVYNLVVPTVADSTLGMGIHWSSFMVRAAGSTPPNYYESAPDSGYSIDNLAPSPPVNLNLVGEILSWAPSADADLDHYRVYAGLDGDFANATLVSTTPGLEQSLAGVVFSAIFLTAVDNAGNEGDPTVIIMSSGLMPRLRSLSLNAAPNPFNPTTRIEFHLPETTDIDLSIYDLAGRRVQRIETGTKTAGTHTAIWNGEDDRGGRAASGIYFLRLKTRTRQVSISIMLAK